MEETTTLETEKITKPIIDTENSSRIILVALGVALILGAGSGYAFSSKSTGSSSPAALLNQPPKTASQDNKTFKDFAEGTIRAKPQGKGSNQYSEGTHLLQRDGQTPVTITSSVVDLSKYEGKKVKVFGETQKAIDSGWLMDVGKVEEE